VAIADALLSHESDSRAAGCPAAEVSGAARTLQFVGVDGRFDCRGCGEGGAMRSTRNTKRFQGDLRRLADLVQREVDAGADTVEKVHLAIAGLPLDTLAKLGAFEKSAKEVRKIQATSIGAIYDLIHEVNHEVGKLARELLDGKSKRTARRAPAAKRGARRRPVTAGEVAARA
jgi:hypothetical protein